MSPYPTKVSWKWLTYVLPYCRRNIAAITHGVDLNLYSETFAQYLTLANFSSSPTADLAWTIQPFGKYAMEAGIVRGGNPLGLSAAEQTCKVPLSPIAPISRARAIIPSTSRYWLLSSKTMLVRWMRRSRATGRETSRGFET